MPGPPPSGGTFSLNVIYIGNVAIMDTVDGSNYEAEDTTPIVGQTFGSAGSPLSNNAMAIDSYSPDGTNFASDEYGIVNTLSYDTGSGPESYDVDLSFRAFVDIVFEDGSTLEDYAAFLFQDTSGNLFMMSQGDVTTTKPIESLTVTSYDTAFGGSSISYYSSQPAFQTSFSCLAKGTLVSMAGQPVAVELINPGDNIDGPCGQAGILWVGRRRVVTGGKIGSVVAIPRHCFGKDLPRRRIVLSGQHRIAISLEGKTALAPAKAFLGCDGVETVVSPVDLFSLYCAPHALVFADGLVVETFLPGPYGISRLSMTEKLQLSKVCQVSQDGQKIAPVLPVLTVKQGRAWVAKGANVVSQSA